MQIYIKVGENFVASYQSHNVPRVGEIIEYNDLSVASLESSSSKGDSEINHYEVELVRHHMTNDGEDVYYEIVLYCRDMKQEETE